MEALGGFVAAPPIVVAQAVDAHVFAGARGVDEFVVTDVQPHMVDRAFAIAREKHRVSRFQMGLFNGLVAGLDHGGGGARQLDVGFMVKQVDHQAAAIETAFFAVAAPAIGCANQIVGTVDDLGQWAGCGLADVYEKATGDE